MRAEHLIEEPPRQAGWGHVFDAQTDIPPDALQTMIESASDPLNRGHAAWLLFIRPDLRSQVTISPDLEDTLWRAIENGSDRSNDESYFADAVFEMHVLFPEQRAKLREKVESLSHTEPARNLMNFSATSFDPSSNTTLVSRLLYPTKEVALTAAVREVLFDDIQENLTDGFPEVAAYFAAKLRIAWPELRDEMPFSEDDWVSLQGAVTAKHLQIPSNIFTYAAVSADRVEIDAKGNLIITPRLQEVDATIPDLPDRRVA